jgi:hypothetical protein
MGVGTISVSMCDLWFPAFYCMDQCLVVSLGRVIQGRLFQVRLG